MSHAPCAGDRTQSGAPSLRLHLPPLGISEERQPDPPTITKTAMEMPSLWKPNSGSHRDLEISHRTRDSHFHSRFPFFFSGEEQRTKTESALSRRDRQSPLDMSIGLTAR